MGCPAPVTVAVVPVPGLGSSDALMHQLTAGLHLVTRSRSLVTELIRKCDMSISEQVRTTVLARRGSFIRAADFAHVGSYAAVRQALSRLARDGELIPVREGLYWRGRQTKFGMTRPSPLEIAEAIVGKGGVGFSGVSAANALGLTSQVPGVYEIAVPVRAPESLNQARFVSRAARSGRRTARLNALEVSLLETLDGWDELVEESYAFSIEWLGRLFARGDLDAAKLAKASQGESARTRVRLKQVLRDGGHMNAAESIPDSTSPPATYEIAA